MIEAIGLSILFLKKEAYTGSYHGIRYRLSKDEDILKACVYPEPYCFEATSEEVKTWKDFEFSQDGLNDALNWIEQCWETKKDNSFHN